MTRRSTDLWARVAWIAAGVQACHLVMGCATAVSQVPEPWDDAGSAGSSGGSSSGSASNGSSGFGETGSSGSGGNSGGNTSSSGSSGGRATSSGSSSGASTSSGGTSSGSASSGSGSSSSGSSSGGSSGGGSGGPSGSDPTMLPKVSGTCPMFTNGGTVTVSAGGGSIQAQIWMGTGTTQDGPLILYWHGTGSSPSGEIPIAFDTAALASAGGIIVGFNAGSRTGTTTGNTGDNVWYQSDGAFADQVVACAIQNNHVSPRRIHTAGYSAGGLQTVWMWFARSGYLASAISYSGGDAIINKVAMQDPSNIAAAIAAHGAAGSDALGIDFANASATWESEIKSGGGFSIDCNDMGNHGAFFSTRAPGLKPVALKFFLDHPFKGKPEPYTSLPSGFPSYCKID